jgi:hypothetical protein
LFLLFVPAAIFFASYLHYKCRGQKFYQQTGFNFSPGNSFDDVLE